MERGGGGGGMVTNTTFNNISVISWRSVLLVEETGSTWKKTPTCRNKRDGYFQNINNIR